MMPTRDSRRICRGRRRHALVFLVTLTAIAVVYYYYTWSDISAMAPWRPRLPTLKTFPATPLANACDNVPPPSPDTVPAAPIPNLVHYVWLLADTSTLSLHFDIFVTVYSAHLFFHPDRIYFHTNASPELWNRTKASGDLWTKRVLNIPGVYPIFTDSPPKTSQGVNIDTFGARSDFLRADALRRYGGIYLDTDAIPLRDVAPLRHAGFANVVGGAVGLRIKYTGGVNTGVWLSRPHSILAEIFFKAMDAFYNGVWAISVDILTDLAYRLHAIPGEVLIMHPNAFAPTSWELEDQEKVFRPHGSIPSAHGVLDNSVAWKPTGLQNLTTCTDALAWLAEREQAGRVESWEMDFSSTYVLHAFDGDAHNIRGWDGKITLKYVLARRSIYARAVYPAIWHAVEAGIISKAETL